MITICKQRMFTIAASGLLMLAAGWTAAPAHAQTLLGGARRRPNYVVRAQRQLQKLDMTLALTKDQKDKIEPILEGREEKIQDLRFDKSLLPPDRRSRVRSVREDSDAKIRVLLNDDQKARFHGREMRPQRPPVPPQDK